MKQCIFKLVSVLIQHLLAYVAKYVCKVIKDKAGLLPDKVFNELTRIHASVDQSYDAISESFEKDYPAVE